MEETADFTAGEQWVRGADVSERFWHELYEHGRLVILNPISLLSTHPISIQDMETVAFLMLKRHQILRTTLVQHEQRLHWKEVISREAIQLKHVADFGLVKLSEGKNWIEDVYIEQHNDFTNGNGLLWRICVEPSQELEEFQHNEGVDGPFRSRLECKGSVALGYSSNTPNEYDWYRYRTRFLGVFHHSIVDGVTRQAFWNECFCLLLTLQSRRIFEQEAPQSRALLASSHFIADNIDVPNLAMGPEISEAIGRFPNDELQYLLFIAGRLFADPVFALRRCISYYINPFTCLHPGVFYNAANPTHSTSLIPIWFSTADTAAIIAKCKLKNTTINSVVTSVAATALMEMVRHMLSSSNGVINEIKSISESELATVMLYLEPSYSLAVRKAKSDSSYCPLLPIHFNNTEWDCINTKHFETPATCISTLTGSTCRNTNSDSPIDGEDVLFNKNSICDDTTSKEFSNSESSSRCGSHNAVDSAIPRMMDTFLNAFKIIDLDGKQLRLEKIKSWLLFKLKLFALYLRSTIVYKIYRMLPIRINTWHAVNARRWFQTEYERSGESADRFFKFVECYFLGSNVLPAFKSRTKRKAYRHQRSVGMLEQTIDDLMVSHMWSSCISDAGEVGNEMYFSASTIEDTKLCTVTDIYPEYVKSCNERKRELATIEVGGNWIGKKYTKTTMYHKEPIVQRCLSTTVENATLGSKDTHRSRGIMLPQLGSCTLLMFSPVFYKTRDEPSVNMVIEKSLELKKAINKKLTSSSKRTWKEWKFVAGFSKYLKGEKHISMGISAFPRTSPFLISNAGKWDESLLQHVAAQRDQQWVNKLNPPDSCGKDNNKATQRVRACRMKIESSWSCVAQHRVGAAGFAHNIVTVNNKLCWSLQYHTNFTSPPIAMEYARLIIEKLLQFKDS